MSQTKRALHIGGSFSAIEIFDVIYNELLRPQDIVICSKGHGWMAQYAILEERGLVDERHLMVHPELGIPGIACSTGSLGHGLGMACGMAIADRHHSKDSVIYVVLSDGEMQEGSSWEAALQIPAQRLGRIVAIVDDNDLQSLGRTSETHPNLRPLAPKFAAFGWNNVSVDGHDSRALCEVMFNHNPLGKLPLAVVARTVKGYGVSFMADQPIWHYRRPDEKEFAQAMEELAD